ncbi:MAG: FG-GAP-like repeat-containing protein [Candidatus Binatia bacterium]
MNPNRVRHCTVRLLVALAGTTRLLGPVPARGVEVPSATDLYIESFDVGDDQMPPLLRGPIHLGIAVDELAAVDVTGDGRADLIVRTGNTLQALDLKTSDFKPITPAPVAPVAMVGIDVRGSPRRELVIAGKAGIYVMDFDGGGGWDGPEEAPFTITALAAVDLGGRTGRDELVASNGNAIVSLDLDAPAPAWAALQPPTPAHVDRLTTTDVKLFEGDEVAAVVPALTVVSGLGEYLLVEEVGGLVWHGPLELRYLTRARTPIDVATEMPGREAILVIDPPVRTEMALRDVASEAGIGGYRFPGGDGHCPGAVFADVNGDDLPDLYLVKGFPPHPSIENVLFANDGAGSFVAVPGAQGAGDPRNSAGALLADYDGDGDRDLLVLNFDDRNTLYENRGGTFVDVTEQTDPTPADAPGDLQEGVGFGVSPSACEPGETPPCRLDDTLSAGWGDIDRDGDLDLYAGNHLCCGFAQGERDVLYRNNGDGTFTDITAVAGIAREPPSHPPGSTQALVIADLNNDLWPDIYAAHKGDGPSRDELFLNDGDADGDGRWDGTFTEYFSSQPDPRLGRASSAAMGVDVGDYDNDGDLDVFVTDVGEMDLYRNRLQRGAFALELADPNPVSSPWFAWGTAWADFDNDGDLDLHVASNVGVLDWLQRNDRLGFTDVALAAGAGQARNSRVSVPADFDGDGWMDLLVVNRGDTAPELLHNETHPASGGTWLKVRLHGNPALAGAYRSTPDAVGARVELAAGGEVQRRDVIAGGHTCGSTSSYLLHFGLGDRTGAEQLQVFWPSGRVTTRRAVAAGQTIEIAETAGCAVDCDGDGRVTIDELVRAARVALKSSSLAACVAADRNGDAAVSAGELAGAVQPLFEGCK